MELKRRLSLECYGGAGFDQFRQNQAAGAIELNQNISMLLEKAQKENWAERLEAFMGL
jgi:HEAT repeat protein